MRFLEFLKEKPLDRETFLLLGKPHRLDVFEVVAKKMKVQVSAIDKDRYEEFRDNVPINAPVSMILEELMEAKLVEEFNGDWHLPKTDGSGEAVIFNRYYYLKAKGMQVSRELKRLGVM